MGRIARIVLTVAILAMVFGPLLLRALWDPSAADYGDRWWWDTWDWFASSGVRMLAWIGVGVVVYLIWHWIVPRLVSRTMAHTERGRLESEIEQRTNTITNLLKSTGTLVIAIVVIVGIITETGLNVGAAIGGLAVVGLAVGFGAQHLVKDLIAGFFILLEDQYAVGDWIAIAGVNGAVEKLNIRRTCIRDLDGVIHSIPNGAFEVASNYTKDFGRCNVTVSVAYKEDLDRVLSIVRQTWYEMADDPELGPKITQREPWILRVDKLGDSGIDIRIVAETLPDWQWTVKAQLKLRLKKIFDELGIEIPWPHTKVYFGDFPEGLVLESLKRSQSGPHEERD
jgi:small-conductance mechanosensitive channel